MPENRPSRPLTLSVLDRLIDHDPQVSREVPPPPHQVLRDLKQAVRRDLEALLNTRVRMTWPAHLTELRRSVVGYGLPDWTGTNLSTNKEREDFCRQIEDVILCFEPRLLRVSVQPTHNTEPLDRTFRFRIDALLRVEPAPEPIVFDSVVKPANGTVEIAGGNE